MTKKKNTPKGVKEKILDIRKSVWYTIYNNFYFDIFIQIILSLITIGLSIFYFYIR